MIIPITNKYRIHSDSDAWRVEELMGKDKDGNDRWVAHYHCITLRFALDQLADLRIRRISDDAGIDKIIAEIGAIRSDMATATAAFGRIA